MLRSRLPEVALCRAVSPLKHFSFKLWWQRGWGWWGWWRWWWNWTWCHCPSHCSAHSRYLAQSGQSSWWSSWIWWQKIGGISHWQGRNWPCSWRGWSRHDRLLCWFPLQWIFQLCCHHNHTSQLINLVVRALKIQKFKLYFQEEIIGLPIYCFLLWWVSLPLHRLLHWSQADAGDPTEKKSYDMSQFSAAV